MNQGKRRRVAKIIFLSLLIFAVVFAVLEIVVAVLNSLAASTELGAYTTTLIAIPVFSLIFTFCAGYAFASNFQKSQNLLQGLDRVAQGDYSATIEIRRGDSFAKVYENFNKMTAELTSVKKQREEILSDFSHEFKTPLCSIEGFTQLLLDGGVSEEEQKNYLRIILSESQRLKRLADGVLTLSKLESQQFAGEKSPFRLDLQIRDCVIMFEKEWSQKEIDVDVSLAPVTILGDASLLRRLWLNLISNAVKFTPQGGKIEISLKEENGKAVASFTDNGEGIAEEDLPKIFDKYYRSSKAKKVDGNGLGLAICKRICDLSEGVISCESKVGEGTRFTVVLPV